MSSVCFSACLSVHLSVTHAACIVIERYILQQKVHVQQFKQVNGKCTACFFSTKPKVFMAFLQFRVTYFAGLFVTPDILTPTYLLYCLLLLTLVLQVLIQLMLECHLVVVCERSLLLVARLGSVVVIQCVSLSSCIYHLAPSVITTTLTLSV